MFLRYSYFLVKSEADVLTNCVLINRKACSLILSVVSRRPPLQNCNYFKSAINFTPAAKKPGTRYPQRACVIYSSSLRGWEGSKESLTLISQRW